MKENVMAPDKPLNRLAIVALVLSILLFSFVAATLGHIALSQIKKRGERGRAIALAAIVLGWTTTLIGGLFIANPYGFGFFVGNLFG